jgi:hypothetical protein
MQLKIYKYTFAAYSAILLLSLPLFYLFPKDALVDLGFDPGSTVESEIYREAVFNGKLDQLDGAQMHRQWSFDYPGDGLTITPDSDKVTPQIFVIRTAAGTGEITAVEYRRETFLTHRLNPYQVALTGNRLNIYGTRHYKFKFKGFDRDFTADQFSEKKKVQYHEWLFHEFEFAQVLYLYIPADVEIEHDPDRMLQVIVNEE